MDIINSEIMNKLDNDIENILSCRIKPDLSKYGECELEYIMQKIINKSNQQHQNEYKVLKKNIISQIIDLWGKYPIFEKIECIICMNLITNSDNLVTECGHHFHSSCMFKSILKNKSCPMCRNLLVDYSCNISENSTITNPFYLFEINTNNIIIDESNINSEILSEDNISYSSDSSY